MYWPIGAPKVYAVSKYETPRTKVTESHDGVREVSESSKAPGHGDSETVRAASQDERLHSATNLRERSVQYQTHPDRHNDGAAHATEILAAKISRGGNIFATITRSALTIWQTKPTVALANVIRSTRSMKAYGPNTGLILRPDALIIVVQTSDGYLITYSLATDPNARVYTVQLPPNSTRQSRKDSVDGYGFRKASAVVSDAGPAEGEGIKEVNVRFRMVIRIDAGISKVLALDDELVVATEKPVALQCIRWASDHARAQTHTELLSKMLWIAEKCTVTEMIHDRPMSLTCWIMSDGRAYAVQRRSAANVDMDNPASLFQGFCFREPEIGDSAAIKAAINARFSLIAIGCANGHIDVYIVKDYMGNIPLSHKLRLSHSTTITGNLTFLTYSPDGYCLLAGYEKGWAMWSVYGKAGASSFSNDRALSELNGEDWLHGIKDAFWTGQGCELFILPLADDRLWLVEMARNALTGCYSPSTASRALLHSSSSIMLYKGLEVPNLTVIPSDMSIWQTIQVPASYLLHQWPIRMAVVSPDGKYIAIAGRRGLAHISIMSGRWRTFDDPAAEHEFAVRGGMCWYQHFLIVCTEAGNRHQIRVYSREKTLDFSHIQFTENLSAAAIFMTASGKDSLLVYTYDNTLLHFIVIPTASSIKLVQVGQIGFHGIIRAPPRVRAISWILPDDQLEHGDPSQDVATASVLFLIDGKLVLLQPSTNENGELKYDMRVIAQNVEYYVLLRDQPTAVPPVSKDRAAMTLVPNGVSHDDHLGHSLRDSLWYFDGTCFHVWSDVQDVLASAPADLERDLPPTVRVPVDFYPLSIIMDKGVISGLDADLVQRRDIKFSFFRHSARTQLFLPQLLRYHLEEYNSPAALHLSQSYQHLPYFDHALELLLHDILDDEVDNPPSPPETAVLPSAISFLSSFRSYFDVIVNCTRKTELRSWRTLFSYLPPVLELFDDALAQGKLKTAAGYLLVLHTFEQDQFQVQEFARLLQRAVDDHDWDLCKELARFLVGIDASGHTLRIALAEAGLSGATGGSRGSIDGRLANGVTEHDEGASTPGSSATSQVQDAANRQSRESKDRANGVFDYFSLRRTNG